MATITDDVKAAAEQVFGGTINTSNTPAVPFDQVKEETYDRYKIALILIYFFLLGIIVLLFAAPIYNIFVPVDLRIDVFKLITTYSGILGPFVGVIAGYYFKS
jgi:hypothetical protein